MRVTEKIFNALLGISILGWGVLGLRYAVTHHEVTAVRVTICALNVGIGWLVIFRAPVLKDGSIFQLVTSLPSFVLAGLAFHLSPTPTHWHPLVQALFVVGGAWALAAFVVLGRNVAILPALRGITHHGPYRIIRHPAYLGELIMAGACCLSVGGLTGLVLGSGIIGGISLRILAEEQLLNTSTAYAAYKQNVHWRLVPLIW